MKLIIHSTYKRPTAQRLVQLMLMIKRACKRKGPMGHKPKEPVALAEYLASQAEIQAAQLQALAKPKKED